MYVGESDRQSLIGNQVRESIKKLKTDLEYYVEFDGLIAELTNNQVLQPDKVIELCRLKTGYQQTGRLLEFVTQCTADKLLQFLKALDTTGQQHVATYIRCDGGKILVYDISLSLKATSVANLCMLNASISQSSDSYAWQSKPPWWLVLASAS